MPSDKAEALASQAEAIISEVLRPGRWPRQATVERFMEDERLERMLALYAAAMELDPEEPAHPWNLSSTLRRIGLNDLALAFMERAVRVGKSVDPAEWDTAGTHLARADTAIAAERYDVALIAIADALRLDGEDPELAASAKDLVRVIKEKKHTNSPARDLAESLRVVPA